MHAFLIVGNQNNQIEGKIADLLTEKKSTRLDFSLQKIADVKDLKTITKVSFGQKTGIVIPNFENATDEAQNSFLKSLEEPQKNIFYILISNNLNGILPTIISRCAVLEINSKIEISDQEREVVQIILDSSIGGRLSFVSKIKDRLEAIEFINTLLAVGHDLLIQGKINIKTIEEAQKTLKALKANGNISLQLTKFIVNLNRS